ncbi:methyltransferase [Roseomonas hellenica]|uniref:Methyltransferase n=1 Tax=Plastoroseomonas hellenica TaxID=2687306 RepID=A0ABS5EUE4_9PROT|nr:hypothetical protein [Plastoroseomonas hellenica]MBR0663928.1 methyltransferase [Plastoroseomonas hellenica]
MRSWLADPLLVRPFGATGPEVARTLAAQINPGAPGPVVVLWPGLGAITSGLVDRGVRPSRLVLIEADPMICAQLHEHWPMARVIQTDAYAAPILLRRFDEPAAAVVAGLAALLRPARVRLRLVLGCLRASAPGAPFVQVTCLVRSPVPLPRARLRARGSAMIWRNPWPARVWTYRLAFARGDSL